VKGKKKEKRIDTEIKSFYENARKILTKNQIEAIIKNKKGKKGVKGIKWNSEDISRAIILRSMNQKCYNFLREKYGLPLPSESTLQRWCSKFQCIPGVQNNVLKIMSSNSTNLSELERKTILSFDEMSVDSRISYHAGLDQALGPFSKVQVVMARGLASPWKQPIYFDFDKTMNKDILNHIIIELENCGLEVVGVVSDLGGCNTLWKDFSVSVDKHYFDNPFDSTRKVYIFADMPHYIKLLGITFWTRA
jgi:hypothetical protein